MNKIILSIILTLSICGTSFGGIFHRQRLVNNHCHRNVQRIVKHHDYYDNYQVELLLVHPQVYDVSPIVEVQKIEKVIEVKEVQRIRTENTEKLQNVMERLILPIIVREKAYYHYNH